MPQRKGIPSEPQAEPVAEESLAEAITAISAGVKRLERSGLNRLAITVLVAHHSKVSHRNITKVLDSLDKLASQYTR